MIKVIVVEDHDIFRIGIATLLENIENVKVIGLASNGSEYIKMLNKLKPDIVFMDIKMPVMDGIEATKYSKKKYPDIKIIALSMHTDEDYLDKMLNAGAMGFLQKNIDKTEVEKAINTLINGKRFFSEDLVNILSEKFFKSDDNKIIVKFTKREMEVLSLICMGLTNIHIGEKLDISPRTVEVFRASMIKKVKASNSVGLVVYAIKNKIIEF